MVEELKYGYRHGPAVCVPVTMVGTEAIYNQGGKFVFMVAGAATLCISTSATIFGHLETEQDTVTSTDTRNCNISLLSVFRIPVNSGTFAIGMVGDVCDLSVDTVQGVALDTSSHDIVTVVGGSGAVYADVMMTPREWNTSTGVEA